MYEAATQSVVAVIVSNSSLISAWEMAQWVEQSKHTIKILVEKIVDD